jgi:CRP-like cAMP-binding protein
MSLGQLRSILEQTVPLAEADWREVAALTSCRMVAPGEHLLRAGEHAEKVFFVSRGILREYYVDHAGRESTRRFCSENEFSGSLTDLLAGGKSMTSIESLDAGEVLVMAWQEIDALADKRPAIMKLLRRSAEQLYMRKTMREFEMLTLSAAERYRRFAWEFPALDKLLSRTMVSSYLGITPVHLSRICSAEKSMQS